MKHDELDLEKRCRMMARKAGYIAMKIEKNGHKGVPDDLFISPDFNFFFVEFKKNPTEKPRPEQVLWMERLKKYMYLIGSEEDFKNILGI